MHTERQAEAAYNVNADLYNGNVILVSCVSIILILWPATEYITYRSLSIS